MKTQISGPRLNELPITNKYFGYTYVRECVVDFRRFYVDDNKNNLFSLMLIILFNI